MSTPPYVVRIDPDLEELIPPFVENRKKEISELLSFCAEKNWSELKRIGHRLAGTAGSYGFTYIGEIAAKVEKAAIAEDEEQTSALLEEYKDYLEKMEIIFEE